MTSPGATLQAPQRRPTSVLDDPQASTDQYYDPSLWWKQRDKARQDRLAQQKQQDVVSPMADSLGVDTYINRLQPIRDISQKELAAQTISSQAQAQRKREIEAAKAARAQQDAFNAAMSGIDYSGLGATNYSSVGNVSYDASNPRASIADMMRKAGFPESEIATGLAVAQGESGLRSNATNRNSNGSIDQGFFQINSIHKARYAGQDIFDPQTNVNVAYQVWKAAGGSWKPWVVYNTGKYKSFLQAAPAPRIVAQNVMLPASGSVGSAGQVRLTAIQAATAYMQSGVGYVWGGNSLRTGVDCSGLVQQVYKSLGINLPRTAQQQAFYGQKTAVANLRPGDLVAWNNGASRGLQVGHIAIYVGNGEIIESYQSGRPARRRKLSASEMNLGAGKAFGVSLSKYVP